MNKRYDELMKNIDILSNVKLKELVDILQSEKIELISELMLLNERINKAIEYINRMTRAIDYNDDEFITWKHIIEIENILRGEDNDI